MKNPRFITSLSEIAPDFDLYFIDLWGVIHDGQQLYPSAKACLAYLKEQNKHIVFISNAPYRSMRPEKMLHHLGIEKHLYDSVISSGEAAYCSFPSLGKKYFYLKQNDTNPLLAGLPYQETSQLEEAEFLLLTDFNYTQAMTASLVPLLQQAAAQHLPMICVNPDKEIITMSGEITYCSGKVAEIYEAMQGSVTYFGKPYPTIYAMGFALFPTIPKQRVLAIGDNLDTDIKGAVNNQIKGLLVTGGILKPLTGEANSSGYEDKLKKVIAENGNDPDFVMGEFRR